MTNKELARRIIDGVGGEGAVPGQIVGGGGARVDR